MLCAHLAPAAGEDRRTATQRLPTGEAQRLTSQARLFVDFADVHSQRNLTREFHQAQKHGTQPVLTQDAPWERVAGMCGSVVFDEEERQFKAFYMAGGYEPGAETSMGHHELHTVCMATSADGVHWERPSLGQHSALGSAANNIVIPGSHHDGMDHFETVVRDPLDSDASRRYKAIGWSSYDWDGPGSGIYTATSADGISWAHPPHPSFHHNPRPGSGDLGPVGDAQSLMVDVRQQRYIAMLRGSGSSRLMSTSTDFVRWTAPRPFLSAQHELEAMYNNTGFDYGSQYLGFLTYFDKHADRQSQELRLLSSRDAEQWQRVNMEGEPLIPCGAVGAWDRFQVMLTGAPPITVGDRLFIYYRGTPRRHNKAVKEHNADIDAGQ